MIRVFFLVLLLPACLTPPPPPTGAPGPDGGLVTDGAEPGGSDGAPLPDDAGPPPGLSLPVSFSIAWTVADGSCVEEDIAADQLILGEDFAIYRSAACPSVGDVTGAVTWDGETAVVDALALWSCTEETFDSFAEQRWVVVETTAALELVPATRRYSVDNQIVCPVSYTGEGSLL